MSTRRQREQRERRYADIRQRLQEDQEESRLRKTPREWGTAEEPEAIPSKHGVQSIEDIDPEEYPEVVLYCRVSDGRQNLRGQKLGARHYLKEQGFSVVRCWGEVGS